MKRICQVRRLLTWFAVTALISLAVGCGGDERAAAVKELNKSNGKRLANTYYAYQSTHNWRGPRNKKDFKEYIADLPESQLDVMSIDVNKLDELFISERDGKPFQIRYQVRGGFDSSDPVIFEVDGVDGVRIVNFTSMEERAVATNEEYETLLASKPQKGSSRGGDRTEMGAVTREQALEEAARAPETSGDSGGSE